jgi:hypothetical protein
LPYPPALLGAMIALRHCNRGGMIAIDCPPYARRS